MIRIYCAAIAALLLPVAAGAQGGAANPVSSTVRQILARESKNLVAAAEEMPADKYSYRPTAEQMTFGHLILHIAGSNDLLCSRISGTPVPQRAKLSDTDPKDKLVEALKASFEYCTTALANADDSKLGESVTLFGGRSAPRVAAMIALTNDWADHYSQAAMYLRLNGLLPPTAQPRK